MTDDIPNHQDEQGKPQAAVRAVSDGSWERTCDNCGTAYKTVKYNQRFCRNSCKREHHRRRNEPDTSGLYVGKVMETRFERVRVKASNTAKGMRYRFTADISKADFDRLTANHLDDGKFMAPLQCIQVLPPRRRRNKE